MSDALDTPSVLEEYDDFIARKRYAEGGEFLELAASAATQSGDTASLVTLLNELVGHYRKNNDRGACFRSIARLKELLDNGAVSDDVEIGTAYLNIGTAYNRFGDPEAAIECYGIAEEKYRGKLGRRDYRWGGLFNNAATAYQAAGDYRKAESMFLEAARLMSALDKVADEAYKSRASRGRSARQPRRDKKVSRQSVLSVEHGQGAGRLLRVGAGKTRSVLRVFRRGATGGGTCRQIEKDIRKSLGKING